LVPGTKTSVGNPNHPQGHPEFDDWEYWEDSVPASHEFDLDAYFISKYELTQAQWQRARGFNPSRSRTDTGTHPVDTVSWDQAVETLGRFDLTLPTEAQWEVAARSGASTRFFTGHDANGLVAYANLMPDLDLDWEVDKDENGDVVPVFGFDWNSHSEPVGRTLANGFGLHDILGNVWEWCLDVFDRSAEPQDGDGLRRPSDPDSFKRVMRGGSWYTPWPNARVWFRFPWERQNSEPDTGVRAARAVRPGP